MPLNVPDQLPAIETLREENVFVMTETRASHQDIRPLYVAILNLMPVKITTETHLLRMLSNSPLQVEVTLLHPKSRISSHTPIEHLRTFYQTFDEIRKQKFDGLIITGAPIEHLDFEAVDYWEELQEIMDWSLTHVTSTLHICWAAQAGLYYHYGIPKYPLEQKVFGVFKHFVNNSKLPIVRGFDDEFLVPHSRYTEVRRHDLDKVEALEVVAESPDAGIYLVVSKNHGHVFVTGHSEYDPLTLKQEYLRDLKKGLNIAPPKNYFPDNDPTKTPVVRWKGHANLLFSNWLNYYVYQETPYDIERIR